MSSETDCELLLPTGTFPRLTLVGLTERYGCAPLPESETELGEIKALLDSVKLPVEVPAATGANVTPKLTDCPGGSESGNAWPL